MWAAARGLWQEPAAAVAAAHSGVWPAEIIVIAAGIAVCLAWISSWK